MAGYPEFPKEDQGQRVRFWFAVAGWLLRSAWMLFQRWPRWVRVAVYIWLAIVLMSRGWSPRHHDSQEISPASVAKLKSIADQYQGSKSAADVAKLTEQMTREFSGGAADGAGVRSPLLAIPFTAPAGDTPAEKLANSTFAMAYGMVAASHRGLIGMAKEPLPSGDLAAALERGRAKHSTYILYGTVDTQGSAQALTIKIVSVEDGSVVWSKSYPAQGADPAKIAAEVDTKIPDLDDD
jgi:hypothetical protein